MDQIPKKTGAKYWLGVALAIGFLAVGLPYWQIPYVKVSLPNTLYGTGLIVVGAGAAAARAFGKARFLMVFLVVGATVPLAVLARVAVETNKDSTSHNLWPFELIIAMAVGAFCSLVGALLGSLPALFAKPSDAAPTFFASVPTAKAYVCFLC